MNARRKNAADSKKQRNKSDARKVLLLDGHSLAFRAFFALPETLVTSSGQVTNAVYGFTAMLIKLLGDERPDAVFVCFDKGLPQFRLDRYPEYKAGRAETPDSFRQQLPLIREVLAALRIPMLELEGYEADDLLATLAKHCRTERCDVVIVTGDRDILQLVRDGVSVLMTRRGISDVIRYDSATVLERYGVAPEKWTDFVSLKGEASDNIPGVPGVGDKTAAELVRKYGDIEEIIAHADELSPKLRDAIKARADEVRRNKELGHLLDNVPVEFDLAGLCLGSWDADEVRKLFTALEFRTLHERLKELSLHAPAVSPALALHCVTDLISSADLSASDPVALAWNDDWLALCDRPAEARIVPFSAAVSRLADYLQDGSRLKIAHDAKPLYRSALSADVEIQGLYCDTKIAAYLLDPGSAPGYGIRDTVSRYLRVSLDAEEPDSSRDSEPTLSFEAPGKGQVCRQAVAVRSLAAVLEEHLRNHGIWELAAALEFPLVDVLARMENNGILIDRGYLDSLDIEFGKRVTQLEQTLQQLAGEEFNVNSQPQLQRVLFEKLRLPKTKRIKTGYSTDAAELEKLAGAHPIIDALLEYREVSKLKNGFTEMLLALIDPATNRIHTTYDQTKAATGRLASNAPNLQNIPIRGDLGRQIRRAFIAPPDHVLLSADYSQIELRVLAHLSEDELFCHAFTQGHDFHATIAGKVYGVALKDVTPQMRSQVKRFSYGIAYGMSAYGVSQRLGIEIDEAERFIEAYYAQFPRMKEFLTAQVEKAKIDGFTTTMFGRRRYLPELRSSNYRLRALGERMALNTPIQGSAADIIKKAMIGVDSALRREPVAKMLLTVHDELVFEVPRSTLEQARELIEREMTQAANLRCGLAVEVHSGTSWAEAHA